MVGHDGALASAPAKKRYSQNTGMPSMHGDTGNMTKVEEVHVGQGAGQSCKDKKRKLSVWCAAVLGRCLWVPPLLSVAYNAVHNCHTAVLGRCPWVPPLVSVAYNAVHNYHVILLSMYFLTQSRELSRWWAWLGDCVVGKLV